MAQYETYQSNAAESPIMRKWLLRALILSLLLHAALLVFFNFKHLENFGFSATDAPAPTPFKLQQVTITNPEMEEAKQEPQVKKALPPIAIEETKPMAEELKISPQASDPAPIAPEKLKVELSGFESLDKNQGNSMAQLEKQLVGKAGALMDQSSKSLSSNQPKIRLPMGPKRGDGGSGSEGGIPGRTSIDSALEQSGKIGNKAIAMRGGALFEWGKAELVPNAILDLQKLGQLIKMNPKAIFIISGHTDHTGTHETNLMLSQQRADAVRDWLVANLGIDPMRIQTIGKADDEALPDLGPDKSIDEQAPNRRVEIVIKTRGK